MKLRQSIFIAAALAVLAPAAPAQTPEGIAGSYLAARHASIYSDYDAAAEYFTRALVRDPSNVQLMQNAMTAFMGLGDVERASQIARRMRSLAAGNQVSYMAIMAADLKRENYDVVVDDIAAALEAAPEEGLVGPLVDGLVTAWGLLGKGDVSAAFAEFDAIVAEDRLGDFGSYHKGLALASVGDFEGAQAAMTDGSGTAYLNSRRGVIAYAQILSQLERNDEAQELLSEIFGTDPDPRISTLIEDIAGGATLAFTSVNSAQDGLAEVFFSVATALTSEAPDSYTLLFSRTAEYLRPSHTDAILLSADLLEDLERYDLAVAAYNRVSRDDPAFYAAELGRAEALRRSGEVDLAIEALTQLARSHGNLATVHVTLGDALRSEDRFEEAGQAYDAAIALYPEPRADQWIVYFARAITHEREGRWEQADTDFRFALELNPGQPQVLNYLGYSLVERGEKLDEALEMIEEAVASRPDSGYITDSLGWVFYRLGRFEEAVDPMEKAVSLEPIDPIINDHLGDVYWAVGRKLEAEFQWSRALSFDPEPDEAERIRRKLEVGLDVVLEEEGADPISVANDDG